MLGNIILIVFICFIIIGIGFAIGENFDNALIGILISIIICIIIIFLDITYIENSETGKRMKKDIESDLKGGIERKVNVYDINGELIESYEGKFDIDYYDNHVKFDDSNGKRHIIYFTTGTIIVDEKEGEQ